MYLHSNHLLNT